MIAGSTSAVSGSRLTIAHRKSRDVTLTIVWSAISPKTRVRLNSYCCEPPTGRESSSALIEHSPDFKVHDFIYPSHASMHATQSSSSQLYHAFAMRSATQYQ